MGFISIVTIFAPAIFVVFGGITSLPPILHTPLMSGSNAISGIAIIGALVAVSSSNTLLTTIFGTAAVVFAMINVVGGFLVTHRMLKKFRKGS
jgi:proton-translocating NAD(P)+ transhydrogenase subunit alpha